MTWTSGVGRACGVLLDAIVRLLALSHINPNALTVMGCWSIPMLRFFSDTPTATTSAECFSTPAWSSSDRDSLTSSTAA